MTPYGIEQREKLEDVQEKNEGIFDPEHGATYTG